MSLPYACQAIQNFVSTCVSTVQYPVFLFCLIITFTVLVGRAIQAICICWYAEKISGNGRKTWLILLEKG